MTNKLKDSPLPCIEINPSTPAQHGIIWLHGLGADGHDFVPIAQELKLPTHLAIRFIFPHAPIRPVTINQGQTMRAWFDIKSFQIDREIDELGIQHSIQQVETLIAHMDLPTEKIILAGFSQGALIALRTGLNYDKRLAGIIALSGFLPHGESVIANANSINYNLPIFIAHGMEDTLVPYMLGEMTATILKKGGYGVSWHDYAGMSHSVCAREIQDIRYWIEGVWEGASPSFPSPTKDGGKG